MKYKYLLHFVHDHLTFRWLEFNSLAQKNQFQYRILTNPLEILTRPYILVQLHNDQDRSKLVDAASKAYLLQGVYEVWAESNISVDDLNINIKNSPRWLYWLEQSSQPDQDYRIECKSFGTKLSQLTKVEWIEKLSFFDEFKCCPNLSSHKQEYCIFEMKTKDNLGMIVTKDYIFGRKIMDGTRNIIKKYSIKQRKFIANTTMDPLFSALAANAGKVDENCIVYDPFVGSGSLIIAAADMGAYVIGSDIDWPLLHGKSRPTRKGQSVRDHDENVRANMTQYGLLDRYLDVAISDIAKPFLRPGFLVDAIVTDPPYGIRECTERIGVRRADRPVRDEFPRYPSKVNYKLEELLRDLLCLAARHLTIGGRLVYFLPICKSNRKPEEFIPKHPCLDLIDFGEQNLTGKTSRLLVVMEKFKDFSEDDDTVLIPPAFCDENFRETYFSSS